MSKTLTPAIHYPPELPVSQKRDDIARAIRDNQVVIVAGATGSGKTTQLSRRLMEVSAAEREGILRVLADLDQFSFSGSISWHGTHVNGQFMVPAGGQFESPRTAAKAGAQRVSRWPQN
jgi:predicted ATPase